jgi:hypothetical protein
VESQDTELQHLPLWPYRPIVGQSNVKSLQRYAYPSPRRADESAPHIPREERAAFHASKVTDP